MPKILQHRRGTTADLANILGAVGEIFVDTSLTTIVVSDGLTTGGVVLARASVSSIAIGSGAGLTNQASDTVAIGVNAGTTGQGTYAVAIGKGSGQTNQGNSAVGLGVSSGNSNQKPYAVAIGSAAGLTNQSTSAVAIGQWSGTTNQGVNAVGLGLYAGHQNQSSNAVAIGYLAGQLNQGANSIAIGYNASPDSQSANSIVINATGNTLNTATNNALYIDPIRSVSATTAGLLIYNTSTKEVLVDGRPQVSGLTLLANAASGQPAFSVLGDVLTTNNNVGLVHIGEPLSFNDTNIIFALTHSVNGYAQSILQNLNSSSTASADFVVNNNRTGGTAIYGDFGINSQNFSGASPFNDPDGTYMYAAGGTLSIGTLGANNFKIITNDTARLTIDNAGAATWTGNVTLVGTLSATTVNAGTLNLPVTSNARVRTINYVIDGGGAAITTGGKGTIRVDFSGTITSWTVLADQSGSIAIDVWKGTYAVYGASGFSSTQTIVGTQKPTLTTSSKTTNITLTSWTTAVTAGDIFEFNVDSASTVQNVTLSLKVIADN